MEDILMNNLTEDEVFEAAEEIVEKIGFKDVLKLGAKGAVVVLAGIGLYKVSKDIIVPFGKKVFGKKGQSNETEVVDAGFVKDEDDSVEE